MDGALLRAPNDQIVRDESRDAVASAFCRHCLTAVLSERSEDKLVFLINVQPVELFARTIERSAAERMGIDDESDQVP